MIGLVEGGEVELDSVRPRDRDERHQREEHCEQTS
jgi:hypothetical protein